MRQLLRAAAAVAQNFYIVSDLTMTQDVENPLTRTVIL